MNEYSTFIEIVRKHMKSKTKQPYKAAIRECIEKGILADYLRREGHDVETFLQAKYDRELDIEVKDEDAAENKDDNDEVEVRWWLAELIDSWF